MTKPLKVSIISFRKGAFIMIEDKVNSDTFFIIKEGKVRITKEFHMKDQQQDEFLNNGDFFGLISSMSGHPREESVQAMTQTVLIEVKNKQFGALIQNNAPIALKIIRSFSSRLRKLDQLVMAAKGEKVQVDNPEQMYHIGNFYHSIKEYNQALYAFVRYVQYCPKGYDVPEAKEQIKILSTLAKDAMNKNNHSGLTKTFKDKTVIFCEHEIGNELYILQEGQVKIAKISDDTEKIIAILKPGDIFGEMSILDNKPRSATAIAFGQVSAMAVNTENFQTMVISQPQLSTKLITILSERLWTGYRQLQNNLIQDPVTKLLDSLLLEIEKEKIKILKIPHTFHFGPKELLEMTALNSAEGQKVLDTILQNNKFNIVEKDNKIYCQDLKKLHREVEISKNRESRELARKKSKYKK